MNEDNGWDFFADEADTLAPKDDYLALAADLLAHSGTTLFADSNMGDPRIVVAAETTDGTFRNVASTTLSFVRTDYINGI